MSAFELPPEHVAILVQAGAALRLSRLPVPESELEAPQLSTECGRRTVFRLLWEEHIQSLRERYSVVQQQGPRMPVGGVSFVTDADLVQMLQWVRCFEYQTSGGTRWADSFARHYCAVLKRAIVDALIERHSPTWVNEPSGRETA